MIKPLIANEKTQNSVHYSDVDAISNLRFAIQSLLPRFISKIVVVCIGTDRSTGDSFGPLVGKFLSSHSFKHVHIYGTLEHPVHAMNLQDTINMIKEKHPMSHIIAIDACLGRVKNIGHIKVSNSPVKPGAGVNKDLPPIGDTSILGVVNVSGFMEYFVLQNTRLHVVMSMAEVTANALIDVLYEFETRKNNLFKPIKER